MRENALNPFAPSLARSLNGPDIPTLPGGAILCHSSAHRMFEIKEKPRMVEKAVLVRAFVGHDAEAEADSLLQELEELVNTLGIPVANRLLVPHREPHARYLIGTGKAGEIAELIRQEGYDVLIFDNELAPAQQRNWEKLTSVAVIDRQEVILDIFGQRAQTKEARLQVELARLEYSLPRLTRAWAHLGKQGGGIGAKGEGESQLEQDKRAIRKAIDRVKAELVMVRRRRATQRKDRQRTPVPNAAIVGYTNAGKSSLLRRLTDADVLVEDKLFATLDTTTRKVALPNHQPLLLTDTVGFVRNLPHRLVEAFNATLEESILADFLIHLVDASHPEALKFFNTTRKVLEELGAEAKRTLIVFNKIDRIEDPATIPSLRLHFPEASFVSVQTGEGMEGLLARLADLVSNNLVAMSLRIPLHRSDLVAQLHRDARIDRIEYQEQGVQIEAQVPARLAEVLEEFTFVPDERALETVRA